MVWGTILYFYNGFSIFTHRINFPVHPGQLISARKGEDSYSSTKTVSTCAGWQQLPVPRMCWEVCSYEKPQKPCQRSTAGQGTEGIRECCFPPLPRENSELQRFSFASCSAAVELLRSPLPAVQAELMDCSPDIISKQTNVLENEWLCKHGILRFTLPDDPTECQLE